ncbi:MAG: ABC transporter substrate-binding protein [Muribaculaceae bacterium]|nr:ABC transporter substrate-binding protein [Muribaculaceae bacterium]
MKKKRCLGLLLSVLLLALLSGCGKTGGPAAKRERVTVAFWGDQLTERYAAYLQERFPEVDFIFYAATNSADFYRFKEERGDLPDILTVRRFALRDVADWRGSLMDLSTTGLVDNFSQTYLRSYTYEDGTVNWLPTCAEVDGLMAGKNLLEDNGLTVPASYQEFVELCAALAGRGVQPFRADFNEDYTCMELLQGLSVEQLTSFEGREWRREYESGETSRLSEEVWLPVFERMAEFIRYAGITPDSMENSTGSLYAALEAGETAMIRGTPGELAQYGLTEKAVMLPYLGEDEGNSWYLTYPIFQMAAKAVEDPDRRQLILDIMAAMLDEEGLRHAAGSQDMIPYNRNVGLSLSPLLEDMLPCIYGNRLYIRLASADMFRASGQVVRGMIDGRYPDARAALNAFNDLMDGETQAAERTVSIETGYPYAFDPEHGSQAASAVMNTLREELGTDLLIGQSINVAGNIMAGDYTESELQFLTIGESEDILLCGMTGEQLWRYLEYLLSTPEKRGSVANDSTLYVSSGFEMELEKTEDGYALKQLTVNGQALDRAAVWSVAVLGSEASMQRDALASAGVTEYQKAGTPFQQILADRLAGGAQLAAPTDYIVLR